MRERGIRTQSGHIGRIFLLFALAVIAGEWSVFVERSQAIQIESHAEKEANLKDQSREGLFNRWTFDQQKSGEAPGRILDAGVWRGAGCGLDDQG